MHFDPDDLHPFEGVEVKFNAERSKYPVSIKASFGGGGVDKSKEYKQDECVRWLLER